MGGRHSSWHATGQVEKAWKRIAPPVRDELAERMGVAGSDLSARNTSTPDKPRPMTQEYAERIVAAVHRDDPTFSLADLGAPSSVLEEDPTVLARLRSLEEEAERERAALEESLASIDVRLSRIEERLDARGGQDRKTRP